jgi:hypothetical protein
MRPPATIMGSVRVTGAIRKLVVNTMGGHPENGSPFERQRTANGKNVFQPLGSMVAPMRQQTVISHTDAHIDGHKPEPEEAEKRFPRKHEQSHHRKHVKSHHEAGGDPIGLIRLGVAPEHWHFAVHRRAPRRGSLGLFAFCRRRD